MKYINVEILCGSCAILGFNDLPNHQITVPLSPIPVNVCVLLPLLFYRLGPQHKNVCLLSRRIRTFSKWTEDIFIADVSLGKVTMVFYIR